MTRDIAAEVEKKFGRPAFKDPRIRYNYNCIRIRQYMSIFQKVYCALGLLCIAVVFIYFKLPVPYMIIFLALPIAGIIFEYSAHFDIKEIDFETKELKIKSRLPFVNAVRLMLKRKLVFPFNEITAFQTELGSYRVARKRLTELHAKVIDHQQVFLAQFISETDAKRMGELLQQHVREEQ